jgi:hypothetical protein
MPMRSMPIRDADGNVIGRACYREKRLKCATTGCRGAGTILCDYPVTRRGRAATCSRRICGGCAKTIGNGLDLCPPHARAGLDSLVTICAACYSSSCAHGEVPCDKAGTTRTVTLAQWKTLLSFGVL